MENSWKLLVALVLLPTTCAVGVFAADRGRSKSAGSIARKAQRADQLIRWFDANQDGVIEPNEVHGQRRYVYERMAKEAGLDPSHSIAVNELRAALARHLRKAEEGAGKSAATKKPPKDPKKGSTSKKEPEAAVRGFGVQGDSSKAAGFGPASSKDSSTSRSRGRPAGAAKSSPGSSSSGAGKKTELSGRIRKYAASLLKRYDRNKNGVLEKDEWKHMRNSPEKADRNGDGVITSDELAHRLAAYGREGASSSSSSSTVSSGRGRVRSRSMRHSSAPASDDRKSYRFLTPTERLPKGLPDWFARKDANEDGQVAMAEYASTWDDASAAEFVRYDLNNDGVITPSECLEAEKGE